MSETNVEAARRGYEALLRGDVEAIGELLAPDVTWHGGDPTDPMACHNRVEALAFMRRAQLRPAPELIDVVGVGDNVVVILRPPPAGDGPPALAANLSRFRDGKVVEMIHFPDPDAALAAAREG
jgi:ketosteroid isomerase-like protein